MGMHPKLSVTIGDLKLKNPVMTASGTFGYGREFESLVDLNRLGAIIVKGLSLKPSKGNPPPRIAETPCGMLNAIGLENIGIEAFIADKLPYLKRLSPAILINIYGTTIEEYAALAARADNIPGIDGMEVNISCPNVKAGGVAFGVDPTAAEEVVGEIRRRTAKPLIVKLSPNVTDIVPIARAAVSAGADALSLINTITGMAIDIHTRRPKIANVTGGLSGPAIRPVALRMVHQVFRAGLGVPLIGIGGIASAEDAIQFLICGADAVQVGTANYIEPDAAIKVCEGIRSYLERNGCTSVAELTGTLQLPPAR